jgi:hypothetical protein
MKQENFNKYHAADLAAIAEMTARHHHTDKRFGEILDPKSLELQTLNHFKVDLLAGELDDKTVSALYNIAIATDYTMNNAVNNKVACLNLAADFYKKADKSRAMDNIGDMQMYTAVGHVMKSPLSSPEERKEGLNSIYKTQPDFIVKTIEHLVSAKNPSLVEDLMKNLQEMKTTQARAVLPSNTLDESKVYRPSLVQADPTRQTVSQERELKSQMSY